MNRYIKSLIKAKNKATKNKYKKSKANKNHNNFPLIDEFLRIAKLKDDQQTEDEN